MKVEIILFGFLRKYSPADVDTFTLELPEGATVEDVINTLKIPQKEPRSVILNGRHARKDTLLKDGDEVVLMTPVEGG